MAAINPGTTGLVAWWELNEESGTRADSHGSNDLTDEATVLFAAGKQGNAADFEKSNSESLSLADNADMSVADIDFMFTTWIKPESHGVSDFFIGKAGTGTEREYLVRLNSADSSVTWAIYNAANEATTVNSGAATISNGTWAFVVMYYDTGASEIGISIDAGVFQTTGSAGTAHDDTGIFRLSGRHVSIDNPYDGLMDETNFWKNTIPGQDNIDWLYNSGNGRTYAELTEVSLPQMIIY